MKKHLLLILTLLLVVSNTLTLISCNDGHTHDTEEQTQIETEKPSDKVTDKVTEKTTEKATEKPTETQKATETEADTEKETDKATETDPVTDKVTETEETDEITNEKPTDEATERVTEKETEKVTEKETESETVGKTEKPTETERETAGECEHTFDEWIITLPATCQAEGQESRKCSKCGDTQTNTLPVTSHKGGRATCTSLAICSMCGNTYGSLEEHDWVDATCTSPKHCDVCALPDGKALGHTGGEATCTSLAICERCNNGYGTLKAHKWLAASCTQPKRCENCTATEGDPLNHSGGQATCQELARCEKCGEKYGTLADHVWIEADCDEARHCDVCGETKGEQLSHTGGEATCTSLAICTDCGKPYGELAPHDWNAATCTSPETCKNCTAINGEKLNHTGGEASCTDLAVCERCSNPYGELADHAWVEADCDSPKHCEKCNETKGVKLGHTGGEATCTSLAICERCSDPYGDYLTHVFNKEVAESIYAFSEATCTESAYYYHSCVCGQKGETFFAFGDPLGHSYTYTSNGDDTHSYVCANDPTHTGTEDCSGGEATCIDKAICKYCKEEYGEPKGHDWTPDWSLGGVPLALDNCVCTTPTVEYYACNDCDATMTVTLPAPGHKYESVVTAPTCSEKGYTTHTCSVCSDTYTDSETEPTGNHAWDGDRTCTAGHTCTECGKTESALGHSHTLSNTEAATCTTPEKSIYSCGACGDKYEIVTSPALGHNIKDVTPTEEKTDKCTYIQHFECTVCHGDVVGETVYHHSYVSTIDKENEANCQTPGVKNHACSECGDAYSETIAIDPDAHVWDEGVKTETTIVYTCTVGGCGKTKSVVNASDKSEASVSVSDLTSSGVEFNEATLDVSGLTGADGVLSDKNEVTLSASTLSGDVLDAVKNNLTEDERKQLGSAPIYNFTMSDGDTPITSFGENYVTVTIPYELAEGEDVDSIAVWYMSDTTPVSIKATYSNGYITFKTNHFSYYTVTRLTPKQRCELYGHVDSFTTVAPTCTEKGYTLVICVRCARTDKIDFTDAAGHAYTSTTTDASCTTAGVTVYSCSTCSNSYEEKIPEKGHSYVTETESASCSAEGYERGTCSECGDTYTNVIPKIPHTFTNTVVDPGCLTDGYTLHECSECDYVYSDSTVTATGHSLSDSWEWAADNKTATVTLTCNNGCSFTYSETLEATEKSTEASCLKNGKTEYTVKLVYNGVTYQDSRVVTSDKTSCSYDEITWKYNKHGHWHKCRYCSGQSERFDHELGEGVVTRKATCTNEGEITYACFCGYTETENIPTTSTHRYVNNVCIDCGDKKSCNHKLDGGAVTLAPTCQTEGEKTYTCFRCGETVKETIPVSSTHTYNEGEITVEASCTVEGEMLFTCIYCDNSYTQAIPSHKGHAYNDGEITLNPSCTSTGTVVYTCERCDETKTETLPSLGGHSYDDGAVEREPSCDKDGLKVYTCENCGNKKNELLPSLGGHSFDEGAVTKEPGCTDSGIKTYTCENCGKTRTETVPSLGGHSFDGDVCTVCGYKDGDCTHEDLYVETVDLSTYGACGGIITVYRCDCGEVKIFDLNLLNDALDGECSFEEIEESYEQLEDGRIYATMAVGCDVCDTVISIRAILSREECITKYAYELDITVGNTEVLTNATNTMEYESHNVNVEMISLSEYGGCEGYLYVEKCRDCGIIASLRDMDIACDGEMTQGSYTDESGVEHFIATLTCESCGLKYVVDQFVYYIDACSYQVSYTLTVLRGDEELFRATEYDYDESHEFEETLTFNGNSCDDGYTVTRSCTRCGYTYTRTGSGHDYYYKEISLDDYSACGGYITVSYCDICETVLRIDSDNTNCSFIEVSDVEQEDANGNIHRVFTVVCEYCGITRITETWTEAVSECEYNEHFRLVYQNQDGEKIIDVSSVDYSANHSYTYEYEMHGDSCEDGYTAKKTCSVCGDYSEDTYYWHNSVEYYYRWSTDEYDEYGDFIGCRGYVEVYKCACGEYSSVYWSFGNNGYDITTYTDANGIEHTVYTEFCGRDNCSMIIRDSFVKEIDGCEIVYQNSVTVIINGETVESDLKTFSYSSVHSFEVTDLEFYGETCEDGVRVTTVCSDCGVECINTFYHHQSVYSETTEFSEYGACARHYFGIYKCACGEQENIYFDLAEYENSRCEDCGLEFKMLENETVNGCEIVTEYSVVATIGGHTVTLYTQSEFTVHHDLGITVSKNDDGRTVITGVCNGCEYTTTLETLIADLVETDGEYYYDFVFTPEEDGYYKIFSTSNRDTYVDLYVMTEDGLEYLNYNDDDGYGGNFSLTHYLEATATYVYRIRFYNSGNPGSIEFVFNQSATGCGHYENTESLAILPDGRTSCEEGWYYVNLCADCGSITYLAESNSHSYMASERYDLSEYGTCDLTVSIEKCACGQHQNVSYSYNCDFNEECDSFTDDDGVHHNIYTGTCASCGVVIVRDEYSIMIGCTYYDVCDFKVTMQGEEILSLSTKDETGSSHEIDYSFTMNGDSCDDGYTVTYTCKLCGYSYTEDGVGHETYGEYVNLSDFGGCGGYVSYYACPCGEEAYLNRNLYCNYITTNESYEEDGVTYSVIVYTCADCGLSFTRTEHMVADGCYSHCHTVCSVSIGENVIVEGFDYIRYSDANHEYSYSYELLDESCKDGCKVFVSCINCDYSEEYVIYDHESILTQYYDLSEYGACGGGYVAVYECPCGEYKYADYGSYCAEHQGNEEYVDGDGITHCVSTYACSDCGLTFVIDEYQVTAECKFKEYRSVTVTVGDVTMVEDYSYINSSYNRHNYGYEFVLNGESCEDGYTVTYTCLDCGYSYSSTISWHENFLMETYNAEDYGFCGGSIRYFRCPCGQYPSLEYNLECDYEYEDEYYTDDNGVKHTKRTYTCSECELVRVRDSYTVKEGCIRVMYYTWSAAVGETVIFDGITYEYSEYEDHDYIYDFELYGESCTDGFTVTYTCRDCFDTVSDEYYDHYTFPKYHFDFEDYGACGGYIEISECPCGHNAGMGYDLECSYKSEYRSYVENGIEHSKYTYTCAECGLVYVETYYTVREGCYDVEYLIFDISVGDAVLISDYEFVYNRYDRHNYSISYAMNGTSCEDGFTATYVCTVCSYSYNRSYSYHKTFKAEEHDLTSLGACSGTVRVYSCPCGENRHLETNNLCYSTSHTEYYTDEAGVEHTVNTYTCNTCSLRRVRDSYSIKTGCDVEYYYSYTISIGGTTIIDNFTYLNSTDTDHNYSVSFELNGESCTGGYKATYTCLDCDYTYVTTGSNHDTHPTEKYNLSKYGACGGSLDIYSCACGECGGWNFNLKCDYSYTSNQYYDEENRLVYNSTYSCDECGLRISHSYYSILDYDACKVIYYHTVIANIGATAIGIFNYQAPETMHDYVYSGVLDNENGSCEDGVEITRTCKTCSYSYTNRYYYHYSYVTETVELDSTCGGYATVSACTCGYSNSLSFSDSLCDFDEKSTDAWIDDVVPNGYYEQGDYDTYVRNEFRILTCAVTHPEQCAYKIRYASYYKYVDGCVARRFVTYQLGYDEETGTYDREITYATSSFVICHSFTAEEINTVENGLTISGNVHTCKCGSYMINRYYYNENDYETKSEYIFSSAIESDIEHIRYYENSYTYIGNSDSILGNYMTSRRTHKVYSSGEEYSYESTYEYDLSFTAPFGENSYILKETHTENGTVTYYEYGYTDYRGYRFTIYSLVKNYVNTENESWERYDYTYSFNGKCRRATLYTNSSGTRKESEGEYHIYTTYTVLLQPTCTQHGSYAYVCVICGGYEYEYAIDPVAHNWSYIAENHYYCTKCGLENMNGASGEIVMEDITDKYGNGENYVVGYWNRDEVDFLYYVSLILHTPLEDGNDEIILQGISFTELENIRAIAFSKSAVAEAALALGYTADMYDVRLTFVPVGSDGSFDYAITLTETDLTVEDDAWLLLSVGAGEVVSIEITPIESGIWSITSLTNSDTYAELYDSEGNLLEDNDDGGYGYNFLISYSFEEGQTYRIDVSWLNSNNSGYIPVSITSPVSE